MLGAGCSAGVFSHRKELPECQRSAYNNNRPLGLNRLEPNNESSVRVWGTGGNRGQLGPSKAPGAAVNRFVHTAAGRHGAGLSAVGHGHIRGRPVHCVCYKNRGIAGVRFCPGIIRGCSEINQAARMLQHGSGCGAPGSVWNQWGLSASRSVCQAELGRALLSAPANGGIQPSRLNEPTGRLP